MQAPSPASESWTRSETGESGIFGVAVSGSNGHGLVHAQLTGPVLLSGGNAGAEGSLLALVACLGTGGYLLLRALGGKDEW